jgi:hypothetical protein
MMTKRFGFFAVGFALCANVAWAQGAKDSSPEYLEAKQRLQEGKTLYGQHNLEGARLKFEQACAVLKTPACLRALGLSQFYTGRYLEALPNLQKSLDDPELDTASRKEVSDLVQQAFDKTAHVEVRAPGGGHIRIDDNIDAGNAPLATSVNVTVGTHAITVTVGDKTERMEVDCQAGKVTQADFASKFPDQGGIGIPGHPAESVRPAAGWIVPAVVGGVGLVGLGLGVGMALASQGAQSDVKRLYAPGVCADQSTAACGAYKSAVDSQNTDSAIAIAGYVAGGVLVVTAAVLFLVWPKAEREVSLVPTASPTSAGLALFGRF